MLASGRIGTVIVAAADEDRPWVTSIEAVAEIADVQLQRVAAGDRIDLGHCTVDVGWPESDPGDLHSNDRSLVLSFGPRPDRVWSPGDLERAAESVGNKIFPLGVDDLLSLARRTGLDIQWFDRPAFNERRVADGPKKTIVRSFFEAPNTLCSVWSIDMSSEMPSAYVCPASNSKRDLFRFELVGAPTPVLPPTLHVPLDEL